jgi:putative N6-adenine-specific DNA methylase
MREFSGWRVGIVTNTDKLAKATGLPFVENPTRFDHGGIKVSLYQTDPLA